MKNKYLRKLTLSAFSLFAGLSAINAQDKPFLQFGGNPAQDTSAYTKKMSFWDYLTKTPWIIQVGPDVIEDNGTRLKRFSLQSEENFYPAHYSIEKRIKASKFSWQYVLSTTTINRHDFASNDINVKYSFITKDILGYKVFDPYALIGFGQTYRDFPHKPILYRTNYVNSANFNLGLGANLWVFPNFAVYGQGVAKWNMSNHDKGASNYLQFSVGFAWKIHRGEPAKKVEVLPSNYRRSKEAEDAAEYIRQILNK